MATRELSAYINSTPTYIFRITDIDSSGVDINNLQVMMVIRFGESNFKFRYLTSAKSAMLNILDTEYWCDKSYCRNLGSGSFAVTVPLWRLQEDSELDTSTISYQVFLYSTGDVFGTPVLTATDNSSTGIQPGLVKFHNILIDEGTISLFDSTFPTLVKAAVSTIETLGAGILNEFIDVFGPLSQTSPTSGPKIPGTISAAFSYRLADLLAKQDLSKVNTDIVSQATIDALLAGTKLANALSSDEFQELFGKTADAVYKYIVSPVKPV